MSNSDESELAVVDRRAGNSEVAKSPGVLIVNADDWGRNKDNTDRILECVRRQTISSVSAMVFMEDSSRAAAITREQGLDAGLHLNFTTPFCSNNASDRLKEHQRRLGRFLLRSRLSPALYHPGLTNSFQYVTNAQIEEFDRLYGGRPERFDGHHHMHLCLNMVLGKHVPSGTIVRRNFSFDAGEKMFVNRAYRKLVDRKLAGRYRLSNYFFSLPPLAPRERLERIFALASRATVEVETHPIREDEYRFLTEGGILHLKGDVQIAKRYSLAQARTKHR